MNVRGKRKLLNVAFCVSGNGILFREAILHRDLIGINPILCIVETKAASDLEHFCSLHQIKCIRLDPSERGHFDRDLEAACLACNPDLIALTFNRLLRKEIVDAYKNRIVNVHMSLLPSFKGFKAIEKALQAGTTLVGATIHVVTCETDAGPILLQTIVPVSRFDTSTDVAFRLFPQLRDGWLQVLAWFSNGRVVTMADGRLLVDGGNYRGVSTCPSIEISLPPYRSQARVAVS